jgi:TrmH family RNA methyltransferase
LRSAAAAGFRQAVLSADCAQPWAPRTLRAGQGAHFLLEIHEAQHLPDFLGAYRGSTLVTALDGACDLYDEALTATLRGPLAWVFGAEGRGVRAEVQAAAQQQVRIPMSGATESLNVAAAAAVCLFETLRRRR